MKNFTFQVLVSYSLYFLIFQLLLCITKCSSENMVMSSCRSGEYFNLVSMLCAVCNNNYTDVNDTYVGISASDSCLCLPGFKKRIEGNNSICEPCPDQHVTSSDGTQCIKCQKSELYDSTLKICKHCSPNSILTDRLLNGTRLQLMICLQCADDVYADQKANQCVKCPPSFYQDNIRKCECPKASHTVLNGQCLKQSELSSIPDRESSYIVDFTMTKVKSAFFSQYYRSVTHACTFSFNRTACQVLANMCVLLHYSYDNELSVCGYYKMFYGKIVSDIPNYVPVIYYDIGNAEKILYNNEINTAYTFKYHKPNNYLNITVAKYSADGNLIAYGSMDKVLDICPSINVRLRDSLHFGAITNIHCNIKANSLWSDYDTVFYEMYLNYFDEKENSMKRLPIPILNENIRKDKSAINTGSQSNWQLTKRFFLFDNLSGKQSVSSFSSVVRYAEKIQLRLKKRDGSIDGLIYPPLIIISYGEVSFENFHSLQFVSVKLLINYSMDFSHAKKNLSIAVGVMSLFAVLWSLLESYKWGKRCGKVGIDLSGIVRLLLILCGNIANVLVLVIFSTCLYWTLIFKKQDVAFLFLPTTEEEYLIKQYLISAFALKVMHLVYIMYEQMTIDLFLVDWEKPRARNTIPHPKLSKKDDVEETTLNDQPVSIWRIYFIANEWNEIQTLRKINLAYQLVSMLFFLKVLGFEDYATYETSFLSDYIMEHQSPPSYVCRFAISISIYLLLIGVQLMFRIFIYERYIEYKLQQFIDLCSMANISMFILQYPLYGYYIHGRSVHGFADSDLKTFYDQLKREEDDLCAHRGLEASSDCQTFQVMTNYAFRHEYQRILQATHQNIINMMRYPSNKSRIDSLKIEETVKAHETLKNFFEIFLQHSSDEVDYVVKDKFFLETILDIEFQDIEDKCLFFRDQNHLFDQVLFYGQETLLIIFEILLFTFIDLLFYDFVLASVVTYFVVSIIKIIRRAGGKRNLIKKTLVDQRFLI